MATMSYRTMIDAQAVTIRLPKSMLGKAVHITVDPKPSGSKAARRKRLERIFKETSYKLPADYRFDREELHAR